MKLTGTNRSFDLIALVAKATLSRSERENAYEQEPRVSAGGLRPSRTLRVREARRHTEKPVLLHRSLPAWWPLQGDKTRSHPELGRQTP